MNSSAPSSPTTPEASSTAQSIWASLELEGHFSLSIANDHLMQGTEFIRALSDPVSIDMEDGKVVIDIENLKKVCAAASDESEEDDWNEAVNMLLLFADLNDCPESYLELANICFTGPVGTPGGRGGLQKAGKALLTKAYSMYPNNTSVMCAYGIGLLEACMISSPHTSKFYTCKALDVLSRAASLNSVSATFEKGCMMWKWFGKCPKAAKQAKELIVDAANRNFPPALLGLARAHETPADFPHADFTLPEEVRDESVRDLFQRAADAGNAEAICAVGEMNALGSNGTPRCLEKALQCYAEAIRKGSLLARMRLGNLYATGMDGYAMDCKDLEKAKKCFWSGIRLHCPGSALSLARLFETEIEGDPMKAGMAEHLYRRAMSLGMDEKNEFVVREAVGFLRNRASDGA